MRVFFFAALLFWFCGPADAAFKETWIRYPAPSGIIALLRQAFPASAQFAVGNTCLTVGRDNSGSIGGISSSDGIPVNPVPGVGFQIWYLKCINELIHSEIVILKQTSRGLVEFSGKTAAGLGTQKTWVQLTEDEKKLISRELLLKHLGPEQSYQYLGIGRSEQDLEKHILSGVQKILKDRSAENTSYLKQMAIDPKKPNLIAVTKLMKVLILSLDEYLLE